MTRIIDGKSIAKTIKDEIKIQIESLSISPPKLAVVIVGDRVDSATYVRHKTSACEYVGMESIVCRKPVDISFNELKDEIIRLNSDEGIDGILIQLPLPENFTKEETNDLLNLISIDKDVDGFLPENLGNLLLNRRKSMTASCTPMGIIELLDRIEYDLCGKKVVVVGRSSIVGLPVALLCLHRNATVEICHSKTANLSEEIMSADVIIAAVGRAKFLTKCKPGAVVIDVGINSVDNPQSAKGYSLVGDCDYDSMVDCGAAWITPVPGGVGPMTIVMLLRNTLELAIRRRG